jgi:hypothetical protein
MSRANQLGDAKAIDLLQKMLAIQLHNLKVPQNRIGMIVVRNKAWVNDLLKNIPKGGN